MVKYAKYEAVVVGVSSGGLNALKYVFGKLPHEFFPVLVVQHVSPQSQNTWISLVQQGSSLRLKEAEEKEVIMNNTVYIAPSNYHMLVEEDRTLSLSVDEKVRYSRPSIDVLFESAADTYKGRLIGVLLTGANNDGANGLKRISDLGGLTIAEDPQTAEFSFMPASAIELFAVQHVLPLEKIPELLINLYIQNNTL